MSENHIYFYANNPLRAKLLINHSLEEIQYLMKKAAENKKFIIKKVKDVLKLPDGKYTATVELEEEYKKLK